MRPIMNAFPILYSLQNCPYAMRARLAIYKSNQPVLLRAIKLNNKPEEMLLASPKGSVPVLVADEANSDIRPTIIDESLDIMVWALNQNDPQNLLLRGNNQALPEMLTLIAKFEAEFIPAFDQYACAKRYHEDNMVELRQVCEIHLQEMENKLHQHAYLYGEQETVLDLALMPFMRKFARVEKQWFRESPYPKLRAWLNGYLQSLTFSKVMEKHELWLENRKDILFGCGQRN